jgi:hypothetical protein
MDLFWAVPSNPLVTISFDVQVHDKYSKKPFHLDNHAQLNFLLLSQMLSFKLAIEGELAELQGNVALFCGKGPHSLKNINSTSLKHKAPVILESPRFYRGLVWAGSSIDHISPSALYTKSASPLPSPPQHLLDNPRIQESIRSLGNAIKVEMPFNVNKLELLLSDHPNQPFVSSVMKGLHEGFWPFNKGEWKIQFEEVTPDYNCDPNNTEAMPFVTEKSLQEDGPMHWMTQSCSLA